jgi:hypothetical protein
MKTLMIASVLLLTTHSLAVAQSPFADDGGPNELAPPRPPAPAPGADVRRRWSPTEPDDRQGVVDPTQASPDMRRILQGEQEEQVNREPPPQIEVVAKILRRGKPGKALLKVNEKYFTVEPNTRFSLSSGGEPVLYMVSDISINGVELQSVAERKQQLIP